MRIAFVHSAYSSAQPSGENLLVSKALDALASAGHEVGIVTAETDHLRVEIPLYELWAAKNVAIGYGAEPSIDFLNFSPEILHVHNLFPNFGTKWMSHCQIPIISTIYNYRLVCANGLLLRNGQVCTLCCKGHALNSIVHKCYRNSYLATIPLTIANMKPINSREIVNCSERIVMISRRAARAFEDFGVDSSKLVTLPYFVPDYGTDLRVPSSRDGWIYVGRISPEKGLRSLLKEWPQNETLNIFGDGSERIALERPSRTNVHFEGRIEIHQVPEKIRSHKGLIFPSPIWETMGSTVLEAFEAGVPVVARVGSAGADLVEEFQAGAVYGPGHMSLREALDYVSSNQETLRKRARAAYEQNFTKEIWLERIEKLYETVIAEHRE